MSGIGITLTADDSLQALAKDLQEFAPKRLPRLIARQVLPPSQRYLDTLVDSKLRVYPPERDKSRRFIWSHNAKKNERARRWFFANFPDGYTRTGALGRAWFGDIRYDAKSSDITVLIGNASKAASYVYGAEKFNYQRVPGHVVTGWLNAGDVGAEVVIDVTTYLNNRLEEVLTDELRKL